MNHAGAAVAAACGFLAGVLMVVAVGSGGTDTVTETITVAPAVTNGGTVIVKTAVPQLVGERLDVALDRLDRAGFDPDVEGGGLLGIIDESNWEVVLQDPGPGVMLEQGSSVHVRVERR